MLSSCLFWWHITLSFLFHSASAWQTDEPAIHFTIQRRGERFTTHDAANLTRLASILSESELQYAKTKRVVEGNRLGRQWKSRNTGTTMDEDLIDAVGHDGTWHGLI